MSETEKFQEYTVVVSVEKIGDDDILVVESFMLDAKDVNENYEWIDDDKTILKPKSMII